MSSASDWSFRIGGYTSVSVAEMQHELTDGCEVDFDVFQWLPDLFSLIASPQILYSGWPAPCEKHINREYLIPQS